jgi:hypothetical protein
MQKSCPAPQEVMENIASRPPPRERRRLWVVRGNEAPDAPRAHRRQRLDSNFEFRISNFEFSFTGGSSRGDLLKNTFPAASVLRMRTNDAAARYAHAGHAAQTPPFEPLPVARLAGGAPCF